MKLLIKQGTVFDPKNAVAEESRDLFVKDGFIVHSFKSPDQILDAKGFYVTPGAIDVGTCFASPGMRLYGFKTGLANPGEISACAARMGYTHIHEAMMFPTTALSAHEQLFSLPYQDTSASLCLALRDFGALVGSNAPPEQTARFLAAAAHHFKALNLRLPETSAHFRESALSRFNIEAKRVLDYITSLPLTIPFLIELSSRLLDETLPVSPNLFYSHIGRAVDGDYAYKQVLAMFENGEVLADIGLIPDGSFHQIKWEPAIGEEDTLSLHLGMHAPLRYRHGKSHSNSELILKLAVHPAFRKRLAFSSMGIAAESAESYPVFFNRLFEADPSFSFSDFITMTRVVPAAMLGLSRKGHLGEGAVADIAIYKPDKGIPAGEQAARCHTLVKGGTILIKEYNFVSPDPETKPDTRTYYRAFKPSDRDSAMFAAYFAHYPRVEHLQVPEELGNWEPLQARDGEF